MSPISAETCAVSSIAICPRPRIYTAFPRPASLTTISRAFVGIMAPRGCFSNARGPGTWAHPSACADPTADYAEFIIGRAFARPVDYGTLRSRIWAINNNNGGSDEQRCVHRRTRTGGDAVSRPQSAFACEHNATH